MSVRFIVTMKEDDTHLIGKAPQGIYVSSLGWGYAIVAQQPFHVLWCLPHEVVQCRPHALYIRCGHELRPDAISHRKVRQESSARIIDKDGFIANTSVDDVFAMQIRKPFRNVFQL